MKIDTPFLLFLTLLLISCSHASTAQEQGQGQGQEPASCPNTSNEASCTQQQQTEFWHKYTIDDLFMHFDCHSILPGYESSPDDDDVARPPKPAPRTLEERTLTPHQLSETMQILDKIRIKYTNEVNTVIINNDAQSVFKVPVIVGNAGDKGRGIYASQPIKKGTLVMDIDSDIVGIFKNAMEWRRFTYTLGQEDVLAACNFMEWCWIQHVEAEEGEVDDIRNGWTVFVAFDESGLVNNAEWGSEVANLKCGTPILSKKEDDNEETITWSPCRYKYHAAVDIAKGDELLINYSEFEDESQSGWISFGVGIGITTV